jgi:hypothetical protein
MLTVTPKNCLVHWPGTYPLNSNVQLVKEVTTLPYQKGSTLHDANTPTKVLSSKASLVPGQEAFMIQRPLPMPLTTPDVRSSDKSESNISPNMPKYNGESEGQQRVREKRNRLKEGRRHRARQRKEAQNIYMMELAEYYKRKSEKEAEERRATRAHKAPYNKIREALEELEAISHPNEEQE